MEIVDKSKERIIPRRPPNQLAFLISDGLLDPPHNTDVGHRRVSHSRAKVDVVLI